MASLSNTTATARFLKPGGAVPPNLRAPTNISTVPSNQQVFGPVAVLSAQVGSISTDPSAEPGGVTIRFGAQNGRSNKLSQGALMVAVPEGAGVYLEGTLVDGA